MSLFARVAFVILVTVGGAMVVLNLTQNPHSKPNTLERNVARAIAESHRNIEDGNYLEAEKSAAQAAILAKCDTGDPHDLCTDALRQHGRALHLLGRLRDAEERHFRALEIIQNRYGNDHADTADSLYEIGSVLLDQYKTDEAEDYLERAIVIFDGGDQTTAFKKAKALRLRGVLQYQRGELEKLEATSAETLEAFRAAVGADHPESILEMINLANVYQLTAKKEKARSLYKEAATIVEGSQHQDEVHRADGFLYIGHGYYESSQFSDAEMFYRRALEIYEQEVGLEHANAAVALMNLTTTYESLGKYSDAVTYGERALAATRKFYGEVSQSTQSALHNLAIVYMGLGRYEEAEARYLESIEIHKRMSNDESEELAITYDALAVLYEQMERYGEAERLRLESIEMVGNLIGTNNSTSAVQLTNLAVYYSNQGKDKQAAQSYEEAIVSTELTFGRDHPRTARTLALSAEHALHIGNLPTALNNINKARKITSNAILREPILSTANFRNERQNFAYEYSLHVKIAHESFLESGDDGYELADEAFISSQWAKHSVTSSAVGQLGARLASGNDALFGMARAQQDLLARWRTLDARMVPVLSVAPENLDKKLVARLREERAEVRKELDALTSELESSYPNYTQLANARPLRIEATQLLLRGNEALVKFFVIDDAFYIWVVRKDFSVWRKFGMSEELLADAVWLVRVGLDIAESPPFDIDSANLAYKIIFGRVEDALIDIDHLIIVPSGPLEILPFGVLVTEEPDKQFATTYADYRDVPWLAKKYAISVLPSVSSLRALREYASTERASKPFVGIGNPVLAGSSQLARDGTDTVADLASFFRGPIADVERVRELAPLPETEDELKAIAASLGVPESELYLGPRASESVLKTAKLDDYRVLAFATHGLVAGELGNSQAEAALVLTPPAEATEHDDGLLTASEVALLKLNADWVILSACNTAAGEKAGAEPLSGLAKAFFYAGSRSLLVSHWPVNSDAAVALTTGTFQALEDDPTIGRAEALRRSMIALMEDDSRPINAHPALWAPFVIVGEGRLN